LDGKQDRSQLVPADPEPTQTTTEGITMSNHFSADNLKFPGDDRRLDLTDVFVFTSADDPDTTVLIIDSNPTSAPPPIPAPVTGPEFYPGAVYRINIDTDGDNHAEPPRQRHARGGHRHAMAMAWRYRPGSAFRG
jgi:hypothetical protein